MANEPHKSADIPVPYDGGELLQVGGDWYVHAASALADDRTRILKDGDTFAVFNRYGDVQSVGLGEQGMYHAGVRHLSQFDLRIAHKRPLFLGSALSEDNAVLTVDMANPEFTLDDGRVVPAESIHISRTMLLHDGALQQRLDVRNYGRQRVQFTLQHRIESDFRDIFEVRGMRREQRGRLQPADWSAAGLCLTYDGLDGTRRLTELTWTPAQPAAGPYLETPVELEPRETLVFDLRLQCRTDQSATEPPAFEAALLELTLARATTLVSGCGIETSNDAFNLWLARSRADLAMLSTPTEGGPYPYAGIPWFSTPFGRDGLITALQTLWVNPRLAAAVLRFLASTQADAFDARSDSAPGKVLHELRRGEMAALGEIPFARYYGSVDATPLFVILAGEYFRATGDRDLLRVLWPHVERALAWIDSASDAHGDGFVEYAPNYAGLIHQGWKDSHDSVFHADGSDAVGPIALVEVQAYAYAARRAAAELAVEFADEAVAATLTTQAERLRERFAGAFWMADHHTFALAIDGARAQCAVQTSNAGHALFAGIADEEQAAGVAAALLGEEMFSGWGVRTLGIHELRYNPMSYHNGSVWPHDNAMIAEGLARYGHKAEVLRILDAMFDASQALDQRLPELMCGFARNAAIPTRYPVANAPQAWAAGSVFMLLRAALGLHVDAAQGLVWFDRPVLPSWLEHVRITQLAVGSEEVDLDLRRSEDGVAVVLTRATGSVEVITRT